ncbi:MAG: choice-of-anchor B family protein [Flavobacterium sp.]|jgi:choice-of-anchor B domain-containing protein|nr:choice-of-anchor B family protein [Flavobacterium sp.]MBT7424682.1 choice-of-anchor B family protein [Flavobacterium sp.]
MQQKNSLIFAILISFSCYSQTPCVGGFAGEYPCNNYDLLSNISVSTLANTSGNPEGSDVWGWTDPETGKEYAIAAMTNSTAFVDITDPINPVFLGRLNSNSGSNYWRDVKIYGNYAFIVADNVGNHGMQVFDLTRLRDVTSPETLSPNVVYNDVTSCHNIVINEASAVAYLVGCNNYSGGPHFVDISDPLNPTSLGGYSLDGYTHDAQVITYNGPDTAYTGKEILVGSNENKVVILDVTDKSTIIKIAEFDYPQIGYTHQGWFTDDQRYFLLGDETDEQNYGINTRTLVFDFQDLDNPTQIDTYYGASNAIDHNGYVQGTDFFMASYRAGMRVLDISNIGGTDNQLTEIGYFDTYPQNNGTAFNGAWSVYPYFASGNIIINDIERGLFVVRKSGTLGSVEVLKNRFSISPNPTNKNPIIKVTQNHQIKSVSVFNILGRRIFFKQNINDKEFVLPIEKNLKGVYIVKVNNIISKKLIVY